jgi:hypothetical protein
MEAVGEALADPQSQFVGRESEPLDYGITFS